MLTGYLGNYDYYLEKKQEKELSDESSIDTKNVENARNIAKDDSQSKSDWKNRKEMQAKRRKLENDLKKTEDAIEALETRNDELDTLMASPEICTDVAELTKLSREKETNLKELDLLYEQWEVLQTDL